jgi:hypothetical protein
MHSHHMRHLAHVRHLHYLSHVTTGDWVVIGIFSTILLTLLIFAIMVSWDGYMSRRRRRAMYKSMRASRPQHRPQSQPQRPRDVDIKHIASKGARALAANDRRKSMRLVPNIELLPTDPDTELAFETIIEGF